MRSKRLSRLFISIFVILAIVLPGSFACCKPYVPASGRLVLSEEDFHSTPNPFLLDGAGTISMMARVYEPLFQINLDGTFVPCLAESWVVNQDDKTITFNLRQNAYWHDSTDETPRPVTSADVVFSFETHRDLLTETGVEFWATAESITALDTYTVRITMDEMTIDVFDNINDHFIAPKHLWEDKTLGQIELDANLNPIGSGPFLYHEYQEAAFLHMKRNPNWWGDGPYIEDVVWEYYGDAEVSVPALLAGELHANDISAQYVDTVMGQPNVLLEFNYDSPNEMLLYLNHRSTALGIKEVRQAINLAIDMQERIELVHNGYATMPYPVPWIPEIYRSEDFVWAGTGKTEAQRIAEANELLDGIDGMSTIAGGIGGIRTYGGEKLSYNCQHGSAVAIQQGAEMIQEDMLKLGIELSLEIAGKRSQLSNISGTADNWHSWDWSLLGIGGNPTLGSMIGRFANEPFAIQNRTTSIGWPHAFETEDDIPEDPSTLTPHAIQVKLRQIRREFDDTLRQQMVYELQQMWMDELPLIVLPDTIGATAFRTDEFYDWNPLVVFEGQGYSSLLASNANLCSVKPLAETEE